MPELKKTAKMKMLLARCFGEMKVGVDQEKGCITVCVAYFWRGKTYVHSIYQLERK